MAFRSSDKQAYAADFPNRNAKHTVLCGAMQSGKSSVGIRSFIVWASSQFTDDRFIFCFKTWKQVELILSPEAGEICHSIDAATRGTSRLKGHVWKIPSFLGGYNEFAVFVYGEGDNPAKRLQGPSLRGAYVDEGANMQKSVREMLVSRLSKKGARAMWTLNPDAERHPFKVDFVDKFVIPKAMDSKLEPGQVSGEYIKFLPGDNPVLSPNYYQELAENYPDPADRLRFIEGEWANKTGLVYGHAPEQYPKGNIRAMPEDVYPSAFVVGIDWASKSITHAVLGAHTAQGIYIIDEWVWDAAQNGRLSDQEQAERIYRRFTANGRSVRMWVVDQTSKGLSTSLAQMARGEVFESFMKVMDGIRDTQVAFNKQRLFIEPQCQKLITDIENYEWPEEHLTYSELKPQKKSGVPDHGCDALRYLVEHFRMRPNRKVLTKGSPTKIRTAA